METCFLEGCEKPVRVKKLGLCSQHYHRLRRNGTTEYVGRTYTHYGSMREYRIWRGMKYRCYNPNSNSYRYYGGKGITICPRWMVFENFLADMGTCPTPRHTIDRLDPNRDYEPGNCRWATMKQQAENRR